MNPSSTAGLPRRFKGSVWTQRSSGNTKFAQVSKRQLLHHREGEVGHLVGHVVANVYQQRLPWDAENLP